MTGPGRIAVGLLFLVPAFPGPAATLPSRSDAWFRLETAHFTIYSNASESKAKEVGLDLERLRCVLLLLKDSLTANSPVPTSVFVFKSDAAMELYKPLYRGKPRNLSGYFLSSPDGNTIALAASWNSDPRRVIYHEYLHYFLRNNFPPQPLWYHEGLAEFYSSFRATERHAEIGLPLENHIRRLRDEGLMPVEKLFSIRHDSPDYNEESRQGVFYAQSWALVHYLMRSDSNRTAQLGRFLLVMQQGRPQDEAFREAFQTDYSTLLSDLVRYIRGSRFLYMSVSFAHLNVPGQTRTERISYEETLSKLGELLAHGQPDRAGEAEAHFQAALAANPSHAGALAGLGVLRMRQEKYDEAAELLRKAVASGSGDFRAHFHLGQLLMYTLSKQPFEIGHPDARQRRVVDEARAAFRRSLELNGDFAEARGALGRTFIVEDDSRLDEGIAELEATVRLLPSRKDLALELAGLYDRKSEFEKSEEMLAVRNRSIRQYNEALALVNKQDYAGALAGFQNVAATAEDPALAKSAQENADRITHYISQRKTKKASPGKQ
ncbi:MAG: tetratricopeptide repeat protein [Thermoanaerobaculia bacterium]